MIAPNYLSTPEDRRVAADAIRVTRRLMKQPALQPYHPEEYLPGPSVGDDDASLAKAAGDIGTTIFHPIGTAKMGLPSDPMAVVDERLRVMGLEGLRVVDASVMPTITSGNTNTPTIMIADKAAQMMIEDAKRVTSSSESGMMIGQGTDASGGAGGVAGRRRPQARRPCGSWSHSDLKILDPIWTTAYIVRNHGYMIYDTLFALDGKLEIKPQMVDKLDGLRRQADLDLHPARRARVPRRHAGHRRGRRALAEALGGARCAGPDPVDQGRRAEGGRSPRPSSSCSRSRPASCCRRWPSRRAIAFIMPKRVAETDPFKQIEESTGSGPFIFKRDEWKPGDKTVYVRNPKYKPRAEPAVGPGRRQGGQGRPRRMAGDARPADRGERAARRARST